MRPSRAEEKSRNAQRPRVICHMATSLDGRIVVEGWPSAGDVRKEYEQVHASYDADGWMCRRAGILWMRYRVDKLGR